MINTPLLFTYPSVPHSFHLKLKMTMEGRRNLFSWERRGAWRVQILATMVANLGEIFILHRLKTSKIVKKLNLGNKLNDSKRYILEFTSQPPEKSLTYFTQISSTIMKLT